jgi:hypothetical protein
MMTPVFLKSYISSGEFRIGQSPNTQFNTRLSLYPVRKRHHFPSAVIVKSRVGFSKTPTSNSKSACFSNGVYSPAPLSFQGQLLHLLTRFSHQFSS